MCSCRCVWAKTVTGVVERTKTQTWTRGGPSYYVHVVDKIDWTTGDVMDTLRVGSAVRAEVSTLGTVFRVHDLSTLSRAPPGFIR